MAINVLKILTIFILLTISEGVPSLPTFLDLPQNIDWDLKASILATVNGGSPKCWFGNQFFDLTDDGKCLIASYDSNAPDCTEQQNAVITYSLNSGSDTTVFEYYSEQGQIAGAQYDMYLGYAFMGLNSPDCADFTYLSNRKNGGGDTIYSGSFLSMSLPNTFNSKAQGSNADAYSIDGVNYGNNGDNRYVVIERYNKGDPDNNPRNLQVYDTSGGTIKAVSELLSYLGPSSANRAISIQVDQYSRHVFILTLINGLYVYWIEDDGNLVFKELLIPTMQYDEGAHMAVSPDGKYLVFAKGASNQGDDINGFDVWLRDGDHSWSYFNSYYINNNFCLGNGGIAISASGAIAMGSYDRSDAIPSDCGQPTKITGNNGVVEIYVIQGGAIVIKDTLNSPEGGAKYFGEKVDIDVSGERILVACPRCRSQDGELLLYDANLAITTGGPTKFPTLQPSPFPTKSPTKNPTKKPTNSPTKKPTDSPTIKPTESPTTSSPTKSPTTSSPTVTPTDAPTFSPTSRPTKSPTSLLPKNIEWDYNFIIDADENGGPNGCAFGNSIFDLSDDGKCILANYDSNSPTCSDADSAIQIYGVGPQSEKYHLYYSKKGDISATSNFLFTGHGSIDTFECSNVLWLTNQNAVNGATSEINVASPQTYINGNRGSSMYAIQVENIKYGNNADLKYHAAEIYDRVNTPPNERALQFWAGSKQTTFISDYLSSSTDRAVSLQIDQYSLHVFILTLESGILIYKIDENDNERLKQVQTNLNPTFAYDYGARMAVSPGGTWLVVAKGSSHQGDTRNGFDAFKRSGDHLWIYNNSFVVNNDKCFGNGNIAVSENGIVVVGSYELGDAFSSGAGASNPDCETDGGSEGTDGTIQIFIIDPSLRGQQLNDILHYSSESSGITLLQTRTNPEPNNATYFGKDVDIDHTGATIITACPQCNNGNGQLYSLIAGVAPTSAPSESPSASPTLSPSKSPSKSPSESPSASPSLSPTEAPTEGTGIQSTPTSSPSKAPTTPTIAPIGFCKQLSAWDKNVYNPWVIPTTLIPFTLLVYGLKWYYVLILLYLWQSLKAFIQCGQNDYTYENAQDMLIADPFVTITSLIFGAVIIWKGGQKINNHLFYKENTKLENYKSICEIILIILTSLIFNPKYFFERDIYEDDPNKAFLFVALTWVYIFLCWRHEKEILSSQTVYVVLFYAAINLSVYFSKNANSMYLVIIISYALIVPIFFYYAAIFEYRKKIEVLEKQLPTKKENF